VYRVLVGKPEGKRLLGRPRCRRDGNIKADFHEIKNNVLGGDCRGLGVGIGVYRVWVEKLEEKRLLGRPRCRWDGNIKADFHEIENNEMGGECSAYGGGERFVQGFGGET
jgi:hypothetical protein